MVYMRKQSKGEQKPTYFSSIGRGCCNLHELLWLVGPTYQKAEGGARRIKEFGGLERRLHMSMLFHTYDTIIVGTH